VFFDTVSNCRISFFVVGAPMFPFSYLKLNLWISSFRCLTDFHLLQLLNWLSYSNSVFFWFSKRLKCSLSKFFNVCGLSGISLFSSLLTLLTTCTVPLSISLSFLARLNYECLKSRCSQASIFMDLHPQMQPQIKKFWIT
jgi:hypothetical protein